MEKNNVHVEFFTDAVKDAKASAEAGCPIYKDVEMVRIRFPGDNKRVVVERAHQKSVRGPNGEWVSYAERFPRHYEAFKGAVTFETGTPLAELPFLTAAQRKMLTDMNVRTAQALAEMPDGAIRTLGMHGRDLVEQARAYIEAARGSADVTRYAAENEAMRAEIARMQAQLAEVMAAQSDKRGPGRPRKEVEAA